MFWQQEETWQNKINCALFDSKK